LDFLSSFFSISSKSGISFASSASISSSSFLFPFVYNSEGCKALYYSEFLSITKSFYLNILLNLSSFKNFWALKYLELDFF